MRSKKLTYANIIALMLSLIAATGSPTYAKETNAAPSMGGCEIFPSNNFWNVPVDNLPVHPNSSAWINSIGATDNFHMDFGSGTWDGGPIGIPYNVVAATDVDEYFFDFYYPDESDVGPYPLPASPKIEYGGDHHILVLEKDECSLYEIYDASKSGSQWYGGSGAIWDLNSHALRPDQWTSADAAGLPILPGLARYSEISQGVISHALRFTANCTADYYVWPARHKARHGSCTTPVPFGTRFRLKADYDISGFSPQAQILLTAFQKYGIVLADNGSDWYVSGSPSSSWVNDELHELDVLEGSDFEAVDTSGWIVDQNTAETRHSEVPYVYFIKRADPNPTATDVFNFRVFFSEPVIGVDPSDFEILTTGDITDPTIVTVNGSGAEYFVGVSISGGYGSIQLTVLNDGSISEAEGAALLSSGFSNGETYTRVQPSSINYKSSAANDGWILESSETSNTGSALNNNTGTFIIGDDASDRQYRSILHFNTAGLPDNAIIHSASIKILAQTIIGTNPFNSLGSLYIDMMKPSFGTAVLEASDFNATAQKIKVGVFNPAPVSGWYSVRLNTGGKSYINKTGTTQFRLYFSVDDNDNNSADFIRFFSGDASAANRPKLIIQYFIP